MAVTFMSREICNHVLLRVHHLANRFAMLLESRVFSSLSKLLNLATRIKVEHKNTSNEFWALAVCLSGLTGPAAFDTVGEPATLWQRRRIWKDEFELSVRHRRPETATGPSFTFSRTERTRNFPYHSRRNEGRP